MTTPSTAAQDALRRAAQEAHDDLQQALVQAGYARKHLRDAEDTAEARLLRSEALERAVREFDPEWRPR